MSYLYFRMFAKSWLVSGGNNVLYFYPSQFSNPYPVIVIGERLLSVMRRSDTGKKDGQQRKEKKGTNGTEKVERTDR